MTDPSNDLLVSRSGHVGLIELNRPPHNFFDHDLIRRLVDAAGDFDADGETRAIVIAANGTAFCAGARLGTAAGSAQATKPGALYHEAVRLFRIGLPIVGAVHGSATGGGLGLALACDLRVSCPEARFWANFTALGFHPGFGLSITLPELIGRQNAALMLYASRRLGGEEACRVGLVDVLVPRAEVRDAALALAAEIAACAPLAVRETRATLRAGLADRVEAILEHEKEVQSRLRATDDFREGVAAINERRPARFRGR
ncbi:MAG: enoyl-CoA hydratase/isomerase family protein [bacterium]|nr:enoyl-CoA hydratase/isomerase family protein [bacterium]